MAEPGVSEIATTSLRRRSGKIANNVENNNAILFRMEKSGGIKKGVTGRTILAEHDFAENGTVIRYEGSETLSTTYAPVISAFEYNWKQMAVAVVLNGLEEVQNGGDEGVIKLLGARIDNAERSIRNIVEQDLRSDGTASGGKQIGGLDLLLAEAPNSGSVGGVTRSSNSYAQNYYYATVATGGAAASSSNIERYMRGVMINTARQGDRNLLWILGNSYYQFLSEACSSRQRFVDEEMAKLGFQNFKFDGVTCILGGGYRFAGTAASAMESTKGYLLNLDYLQFQIGKGRYFQPLKERDSTNQDAMIRFMVFCGNMTCSNFGLQGVLFDS